jgi:hypothetical protein
MAKPIEVQCAEVIVASLLRELPKVDAASAG